MPSAIPDADPVVRQIVDNVAAFTLTHLYTVHRSTFSHNHDQASLRASPIACATAPPRRPSSFDNRLLRRRLHPSPPLHPLTELVSLPDLCLARSPSLSRAPLPTRARRSRPRPPDIASVSSRVARASVASASTSIPRGPFARIVSATRARLERARVTAETSESHRGAVCC